MCWGMVTGKEKVDIQNCVGLQAAPLPLIPPFLLIIGGCNDGNFRVPQSPAPGTLLTQGREQVVLLRNHKRKFREGWGGESSGAPAKFPFQCPAGRCVYFGVFLLPSKTFKPSEF